MYKPTRTKELLEQFDKLCETYKGDLTDLEKAIGTYFVGRRLGWKVVLILHDRKTIRKYESILKIRFRYEFEEFEDQAKRTNIYRVLKTVSNFWKAVSGAVTIERSSQIGVGKRV
jgi:phage host-nuclease inhibitor protein Gam